ncbi:MAG: helix-turn-helix domain-containing protein [Pseudomonadota bacterium]
MRVLWWRGRDVDADSVLAFPIDGELASISGPDFAVFTLSVHEQDLWELADALEVDVANSNVRPEVFRAPVDVLADVRRRLARAVDGRFGTIDGVLRHCAKLLAPYWLGGRRAHQWRPALALRRHAIRASLELLEAGELETIRPADLTRHAGVSERTLEYAFRERYRLTPAAFVKAIRLARVRQELRNADPVDGRVGEAMAANGFYHVGQFARDYRRLFGELPSTTLAR